MKNSGQFYLIVCSKFGNEILIQFKKVQPSYATQLMAFHLNSESSNIFSVNAIQRYRAVVGLWPRKV
ncbi:hypothetical protein VNO77_25174 [Canavalia gladiata]|uniref:Uncharacterized protein n=1 Tax=Canavalia gladiata TaxID=3824 RepID=A0AAN9LA59_CANGL